MEAPNETIEFRSDGCAGLSKEFRSAGHVPSRIDSRFLLILTDAHDACYHVQVQRSAQEVLAVAPFPHVGGAKQGMCPRASEMFDASKLPLYWANITVIMSASPGNIFPWNPRIVRRNLKVGRARRHVSTEPCI